MALNAPAVPVQAQSYGPPQQPYLYGQASSQAFGQPFSQSYPPPPTQPMSTYSAQREPAYGGPNPLSPNGGGQNLQELLANLRQAPQNQIQSQHMPAANAGTPDLGVLLSNVARQQNQTQGYPAQQYHQQTSNNQFAQRTPLQPYTNSVGMSPYAGSPRLGGAPQQGSAQNVQNIMDQLAKWKQ